SGDVHVADVQHRDLSRAIEVDAEAAQWSTPEFNPAHRGVSSVFLRADVRHVLVRNGGLPATDDTATAPVGIRLVRSSTKIRAIVVRRRAPQAQPRARRDSRVP